MLLLVLKDVGFNMAATPDRSLSFSCCMMNQSLVVNGPIESRVIDFTDKSDDTNTKDIILNI